MLATAWWSDEKPAGKCLRWFALRPRLTLLLAVLAALGPFLAKPFNIDDPLFVWAAKHIQAQPTNPYGFDVNWYGTMSPMWEVTKNPPLACYYLAAAGSILGWSELALHLALLLPAIAVILGTYRLALRFCHRPLFAACATLFTPVFLVSSTTVMCDTLMLAFWVWAVVLWVEGLERDRLLMLAGSGVLMALAALTKYFGLCVIPLLAAYSVIAKRRIGPWAMCLLIPLATLAVYQYVTHLLYGKGLLSDAKEYVAATNRLLGASTPDSALTVLAFTGGCLAVATFVAPLLWRPSVLAGLGAFVLLLAGALFIEGTIFKKYGSLAGTSRILLAGQIVFWAFGGASVVWLAIVDVWQRRDAISGLLALWVLGTFLFAGFFNWIVNGRSLLPLTPAVAILLARRLERCAAGEKDTGPRADVMICFAVGAVLSLWVTRSDYQFARAVRDSAEQTWARYGRGENTLWFEGHWGFQYYLEKLGAHAVAAEEAHPQPGDLLAIPLNNSNMNPPDAGRTQPWKGLAVGGPRQLATTSREIGAGFYASLWGPLPFAFGRVPPERVLVYRVGPRPDNGSADPGH